MGTPGRIDSVSGLELRGAIGGFATGVAVVTTEWEGRRYGMTVNSLTSVSLEPPLVLVSMTRGARTLVAIGNRREFVVNLLSGRQSALASRFARPGDDHFEDLPVYTTASGLPLLPRGVGRLECSLETVHDGGDHEIVLGRVIECETHKGSPLVYYRGRFHELHGEGHDAPWVW